MGARIEAWYVTAHHRWRGGAASRPSPRRDRPRVSATYLLGLITAARCAWSTPIRAHGDAAAKDRGDGACRRTRPGVAHRAAIFRPVTSRRCRIRCGDRLQTTHHDDAECGRRRLGRHREPVRRSLSLRRRTRAPRASITPKPSRDDRGVDHLTGTSCTPVNRAAAALILAGLVAEGETTVRTRAHGPRLRRLRRTPSPPRANIERFS